MAGHQKPPLKPSPAFPLPLPRIALGIAAALAASLIASRFRKHRKSIPPPSNHDSVPPPSLPDSSHPQQLLGTVLSVPDDISSENSPLGDQVVHVPVKTEPSPEEQEQAVEQENEERGVVVKAVDNKRLKEPAGMGKVNGIQLSPPDLHENGLVDVKTGDTWQNGSKLNGEIYENSNQIAADTAELQCSREIEEENFDGIVEKPRDVKRTDSENCSFTEFHISRNDERDLMFESYSREDHCKKDASDNRNKDGGIASDDDQQFLESGAIETKEKQDVALYKTEDPILENVELKTEHVSLSSFPIEDTVLEAVSSLSQELHESFTGVVEAQELHDLDHKLDGQHTVPEKGPPELPSIHFAGLNGHSELSWPVSPQASLRSESAILQQIDPPNLRALPMQEALNTKPEEAEGELSMGGNMFYEMTVTSHLLAGEIEETSCQSVCTEAVTKNEKTHSSDVGVKQEGSFFIEEREGLTNKQRANTKAQDHEANSSEVEGGKEGSIENEERANFIIEQPDNMKMQDLHDLKFELHETQNKKARSSEVEGGQEGSLMNEETSDFTIKQPGYSKTQDSNLELREYNKEPVQVAGSSMIQQRQHANKPSIMSVITRSKFQGKAFLPVEVSFVCLLIGLLSITLWYLGR